MRTHPRLLRSLTADREHVRFWECSCCEWRYMPDRHPRLNDAMSSLLGKSAFEAHSCKDFEPRNHAPATLLARFKSVVVGVLSFGTRLNRGF